ncbi:MULTISPECIES: hypothetical protein [Acetobacter]|jgi:hypothetical protein|uniref:Glycine zipper 2TM domain-containing protein n=1 Tax=Acetobacter lovaniensis TaxID=104100 RepID=A0A841QC06_9PROT|nr:hypothetical protein [Acetobacter lovaniensis]
MRLHRVMTLGLASLMAATVGATVVRAEPGGCLKYGAAGAVGGHLANHTMLGATAGCVTGMYRRHEYRKEARNKAKLYDQEHPGAKGTYEQKATAYDVEHSTTPGSTMAPSSAQPGSAQPQQPASQQGEERL